MTQQNEIFYTIVGCLDGRCLKTSIIYGEERFGATYPDSITDAGIVGRLTTNPPEQFLERIKRQILFSITRHNAKGIVVSGHQECGGNQIDDATHIKEIREAVALVEEMTDKTIDVVGIFVKKSTTDSSQWIAEEV